MTDAMAGTFRPLDPLKGWRRVAVQAWRAPHDPSVYATLDIPMGPALTYLDRLRAETGMRVAGGEMARTVDDLLGYLEADALDVYQPDVVLAGGMSRVRTVAELALSGDSYGEFYP